MTRDEQCNRSALSRQVVPLFIALNGACRSGRRDVALLSQRWKHFVKQGIVTRLVPSVELLCLAE